MTLDEIAAITGGSLVNAEPSAEVSGAVEYDSRKISAGGLFVAFEGEKVDGHAFAATAVSAGATAVLGTRDTGQPGIIVADPLDALARLAHAVVQQCTDLTVVGVTGSSGKTTTKDYLGQLLSGISSTVALAGSLNNELGFPYTVLQATEDTRFLVLEMGARGIGHIRRLCEIARPYVGVVLNVGVAHIGEFGSVESTARAKGELVEALPADGVAVLNADDPLVAAMASRTDARVLLVGEAPNADVRATEVTMDGAGRAAFRLTASGRSAEVHLRVVGRHQVGNTLAAAAVALALGLPFDEVTATLGQLGIVSDRRMDVFARPDGVTVIDDSYNANPSSTAAALRALAAMTGRRRIAVLGYMAELGEHERAGHVEVGRLAAELGVDRVVAVAENARPILVGAGEVVRWTGEAIFATDQSAAVKIVEADLRAGDVVLVKGSRYRTWDVVDALRMSGERTGTGTDAATGNGNGNGNGNEEVGP